MYKTIHKGTENRYISSMALTSEFPKIVDTTAMRTADEYTIKRKPVRSTKLMEDASEAFTKTFSAKYSDKRPSVLVCSGTGNNGGDGLVIARFLKSSKKFKEVQIWCFEYNDSQSAEFGIMRRRVRTLSTPLKKFLPGERIPEIKADIVIDALFGSGLNRPLEEPWKAVVNKINASGKTVVSVDVPSGLTDKNMDEPDLLAVKADMVITFERPKLPFLFPEYAKFAKAFEVVEIGLLQKPIQEAKSFYYWVTDDKIRNLYRRRENFSHKGTYGHSLLVAGAENTMGAALLCAEACLQSGSGLTTLCIPSEGLSALNMRLPEVMFKPRTAIAGKLDSFNVVGIGPGLGQEVGALKVLKELIDKASVPMVVDADALNLLAKEKNLLGALPEGSILTPHMKEFDRLFGKSVSWKKRVEKMRRAAMKHKLIIVLKNQYSFTASPEGEVFVNSTGNPGMASGGMGDVLTGVITALVAQGYGSLEAAVIGNYVHGLAGDQLKEKGLAVIKASQLAEQIPYALQQLAASGK